jgi:hypothetical protein
MTLLLLILGIPGHSRPQSGSDGSKAALSRGTPLRQVAAPLRDAWLRFHEKDLCLDIDAVFVFQPKGMEIWCRAGDEGSLRELNALLAPLQSSYRIDLYATYSDREKKPWAREDDDPPPSLWTNEELRTYFRDPNIRWGVFDDLTSNTILDAGTDPALKRRMKIFSDQIFEWMRKMDRLAGDLPSLAGAGYGADRVPEIQERARAVSRDHAREVGRHAGRLLDSLRSAFPRGSDNDRLPQDPKPSADVADSPYDSALRLASRTRDLNQRILRFFYPQEHTVTLTDLRVPGLLDLIRAVQQDAADFERQAARAPARIPIP